MASRFTLMNDALARGQIAGSRTAKAGLVRAIPPGCARACLGIYESDPEIRGQFARGFALGYDTARGSRRTGADSPDDYDPWSEIAQSVTKITDKAVDAAHKPPAPSGSTPTYGPTPPPVSIPSGSPSYTTKPGPLTTYKPPPPPPQIKPSAPLPVKTPPFQPPVKAGIFGLSRNASIALGVGAAVAIVGGVYFGTRKDDAAPQRKE